jgi:hypothetical protein
MSNSAAINILLNPVIDIAKFNQIISSLKTSFTDLNPIDGKKLTASLSSIKPSFVGLNAEAKGLSDELVKAANNTKAIGENAKLANKAFDFNNMVNAVQNISSAFNQITSVGVEFEDGLAAVSAITGFTGDKLDVLGVSARNLAKEFGGSATSQLSSFQGILSKIGPEMAEDSEALATYAKNVNILSKASGDDAATSMMALTDSLLQMGLASGTPAQIANESTKAINILAASAQVGAAEIPQVAAALLQSGVAAKGANMSLVDVNAAIQVLAVGGKTGAEAGTALRNVLGLMQKASGPAEAAMGKLGTSSKELGSILTTQGLDVALAKLNEGMNKVGTDAEKNAIMMEIFGTENAAAAGIMLQNTDKFAAFSRGIEEGMQGQGAAFEQAGIRMNTAGQMIERVQAYVSDAFVGITQSIGQGATALIGASAQFAPLISSFAGLGSLIPEGMFDNAIGGMKSLGATILSSVVPGLVTQDIATKSIVFNTNALTLANVKNAIASKAKLALDYLQTTAIYGLVTGQMSLNAAMLANPIGLVIAGAVALGGALYLLYDNVESVRNVFDTAWGVIVDGAKIAWDVIKQFGSVLYDIGAGIVEVYFVTPFKLAWSVISGIGSAIGGLVGSLLGVSGAGLTLQNVFIGIQQVGQIAISIFNTVKATIAGITGAVGAFTDSVSEGIGKVFSLDFGGAWDSFTGAGDKAAQAFNDKFADKMRTANFDEAAKSIEKGLESAKDIEVKVKAKTDFQDTLTKYQEVQNKINDLASKPKNSLTKEQEKEFESLKLKAAEYSTAIQKVAPNTVNSMSSIVGSNGQLTTMFDINIDKAKQFGAAADYTKTIDAQKNAVSKSIADMTFNYASQEDVVKKMKKELEKPVTDGKENDKLKESFADAIAKAEEMKTKLIENFTKAGEAGMLTDDAIKGVAKSLKTTEQEAKKMLLVAELKKAADAGVLTEEMIGRIGDKYGYTKEQAIGVSKESTKQTDNVKETVKEVANLAEAWDDVSKKIKGASETSKKQFVSGASYLALLKKNPELAQRMYDAADASAKSMFDKLKSMGDEEAKNYLKNGLDKALADKKNAEIVENTQKAQEALVDGKKKETSESKKSTAEKKSQYEIDKDSLATLKEKQAQDETAYIKSQEFSRLKSGFIETENSKLNDSIAKNQRVLAEYKAQQTVLDKMLIDANGLSDKDGKRTQAVNDTKKAMEELNNKITALGTDNDTLKLKIDIDNEAQKQAFEKLKLDAQNLELEGKVKLGLISETEKIKIEIDKIEYDKTELNKTIAELENQLAGDKTNIQLAKMIQEKKNDLIRFNNDLAVKDKEYLDKTSRDRISSIANSVERERALKLYELQKTYDEEIVLAKGNAQKLLVINATYSDARNKIEQSYLAQTSITYNAVSKLSTAFANIKVGSADKSKIMDLNKTKSDLNKERQEIENSYAVGTTDYASYQKLLSDIQNKESENRIAIEQAEAEKRKAIWSGFTTAISGYFGSMYDEYSKKASESVDKITLTHQAEYERKRDLSIAEKALKYATETDNYMIMSIMSAKRQELQNQEANNTKITTEATSAAYGMLAVASSAYLGQMLVEQKNIYKALAMSAFQALKGMAAIYMAKITAEALAQPDSVATFGSTGIGRAAIIGALLYGAIGAAESAVMGAFYKGVVNFKGKGTGTSDSNLVRISHGESVMTAKATANPINQKFFEHANSGGDIFSFLQFDKDIQKQLAQQRLMQSYESVSKQREMFDRIVEDNRNTIQQLRDSNRELKNEVINMKTEIVKAFRENVQVQNYQNWGVKVENKIIQAVEQLDLSGR